MAEAHREESETPRPPALTALIVAQARAMESARPDRLFNDPLAAQFVLQAGPSFSTASPDIANLLTLRAGYIAIRTRFFDNCLIESCLVGCRQVVLLASGFDARAFRLTWPEGISLFEVDLPDVLAFKERVLVNRSAAPSCRRVVVPADLRDDWTKELSTAGFLPARPTAWLAEGILMYLAETERERLLNQIGKFSAAGSRLALDQRGLSTEHGRKRSGDSARDGDAETENRDAREAAEAQARGLGVRIPGETPEPSVADPAGWLASHGWRARAYDAVERFGFYGRSPGELLAAGPIRLWLLSAERAERPRLPRPKMGS